MRMQVLGRNAQNAFGGVSARKRGKGECPDTPGGRVELRRLPNTIHYYSLQILFDFGWMEVWIPQPRKRRDQSRPSSAAPSLPSLNRR